MSKNTFQQLKTVLKPYEKKLVVLRDTDENYYLNTPLMPGQKKAEFFGAVQVKKTYVAFHLMPVYYFPELLIPIGKSLKDRMQGKSCFNFKEIDAASLKELSTLTKRAFDQYKSLKKV